MSQAAAEEISGCLMQWLRFYEDSMVIFDSSPRAFCVGGDVSTNPNPKRSHWAVQVCKKKTKNPPAVTTHSSSCCIYLCRAGNGWWWVPLTAPLIGGLLGGGVYRAMVEMHHPPDSEEREGPTKEELVPLGKQENTCNNTCGPESH